MKHVKRRRRSALWLLLIVPLLLLGVRLLRKERPCEVPAPVRLGEEEILCRIEKFARRDPDAARVLERRETYPLRLLAALANNPEMAAFAAGYPGDGTETGGFTAGELSEDRPLLLQWDPRWGYVPYGDANIGLNGCGPVCLSMAILALTGDETATPQALAAWAEENGCYVDGYGTEWRFVPDAAPYWGVEAREIPLWEDSLRGELDAGHPVICCVGEGDFTTSGHFLVLWAMEGRDVILSDPNCRARSETKWAYDRLAPQIEILWALEPA